MGIIRVIELLLIFLGILFIATEILLPLVNGGKFFPSLRKNSGTRAVVEASEVLAEVKLKQAARDIARQADQKLLESKGPSGGASHE